VHAPLPGKAPWGSIILDHEGAPCIEADTAGVAEGRWRGVLGKGFGPDGKRGRYKVSGVVHHPVGAGQVIA
jgi:hypothetical protein